MKELIGRMQKDLMKLQKTLKKEIDDLGAKLMSATKSENVSAKTRQIEKLLESKLKQFEPAVEKFYSEVKTNVGKYGIDLSGLEKQVKKRFGAKPSGTTKAKAKKKVKVTAKPTTERKAAGRTKKKTAR